MRRTFGVSLIQLILVVCGIAALAAYLFPIFATARESARKATCLSNIKCVALNSLMYAQDYDNRLPVCVADDRDGTAHAVAGLYKNWKRAAFERDVRTRYGEKYLDGRWMWQLADAIVLSGRYMLSKDELTCPTLIRCDPSCEVRIYVVGQDKETGAGDPRDPLINHIAGARGMLKSKTWQSGSYAYMCMHYPYHAASDPTAYNGDLGALWGAAQAVGWVERTTQPEQYFACGNEVGVFDDPVWKPLAMCRSFGVHEGYSSDYVNHHMLPRELGGSAPTILVATPVAFVDGHAHYMRLSFYDMLAMIVWPNQVCYGHTR